MTTIRGMGVVRRKNRFSFVLVGFGSDVSSCLIVVCLVVAVLFSSDPASCFIVVGLLDEVLFSSDAVGMLKISSVTEVENTE